MASRSSSSSAALAALVLVAGACASEDVTEEGGPEPGAELLGGETTVFERSPLAYSLPARNLTSDLRDTFSLGDHFFNRGWVTAPASAEGNDGLGPTYNATSCSACHLHDGRGAPPKDDADPFMGLLVRLSVPGTDAHGGPSPEPTYGGQLNPFAILGVPAEATPHVTYEERAGTFADGEAFSLRVPRYTFDGFAFGPFASGTMTSPRVAPAMIGLGLIEAVPEDVIVALADPDDRDGDGVSGRPNRVWDVRTSREALGRFGWKANVTTLEQQSAGAFLGDLGITTSLFVEENCPAGQDACRAAPNGGAPELNDSKLAAIVLYARTLAVPARRDLADARTRRGEALFGQAGCASCHTAKLTTGDFPGIAAISRQTIRPYTDVLLHDMGPELADGRPDFAATGTEWRTPPLWGIGLLGAVSKHTFLMHDGRARDLKEAILWHGGEAERSREAFRTMRRDDREALLAFLGSL